MLAPSVVLSTLKAAVAEARKEQAAGDVPVGAVILDKDKNLISSGHNQRELNNDPLAHAEIVAIKNRSIFSYGF